ISVSVAKTYNTSKNAHIESKLSIIVTHFEFFDTLFLVFVTPSHEIRTKNHTFQQLHCSGCHTGILPTISMTRRITALPRKSAGN
ncbi:hypothetical protein, partial [Citrobacter sp. TBCS-14]|uniref:hypothetical protein n=1 Tax=Citrobacter sp. TBCS-14 TaxID=2576409 RepID=UPI001C99A6C6